MENELRPKRIHRSAAEKAEIVAAFLHSGLSQQKFALQQGIACSNLQRWVRQRQTPSAPTGSGALVEVPNLLTGTPCRAAYRLHFAGGLQLEVMRGFEIGEVRALAQLLQAL